MSRRKRKPLIVVYVRTQLDLVEMRKAIDRQTDLKADYHFIVTCSYENSDRHSFVELGSVYANNSNLKAVEERLLKEIKKHQS